MPLTAPTPELCLRYKHWHSFQRSVYGLALHVASARTAMAAAGADCGSLKILVLDFIQCAGLWRGAPGLYAGVPSTTGWSAGYVSSCCSSPAASNIASSGMALQAADAAYRPPLIWVPRPSLMRFVSLGLQGQRRTGSPVGAASRSWGRRAMDTGTSTCSVRTPGHARQLSSAMGARATQNNP